MASAHPELVAFANVILATMVRTARAHTNVTTVARAMVGFVCVHTVGVVSTVLTLSAQKTALIVVNALTRDASVTSVSGEVTVRNEDALTNVVVMVCATVVYAFVTTVLAAKTVH
jgi:hypothetical protein